MAYTHKTRASNTPAKKAHVSRLAIVSSLMNKVLNAHASEPPNESKITPHNDHENDADAPVVPPPKSTHR